MPRIPVPRLGDALALAALRVPLAEGAPDTDAPDGAAPAPATARPARTPAPLPMIRSEAGHAGPDGAAARSLAGLKPPRVVRPDAARGARMPPTGPAPHPPAHAPPRTTGLPASADRTPEPVRSAGAAQPAVQASPPAVSIASDPRPGAADGALRPAVTKAMHPAEIGGRRRVEADSAVERWLAALVTEPNQSGPGVAQQAERAGIIASFILNASLIPGWPPPRPFEAPSIEGLVAGLARKPGGLDAVMSGLVLKDLQRRSILRNVRRRLARLTRSRRLRMILGLTILLTAIAVLEAELLRLAGELRDEADTVDRP